MGRRFSKPEGYFNKLNYTLSNEDPGLELGILPEGCPHVLAIAGSGARVLPLFAKHPEVLSCVDASTAQLALTQLRIESLRSLSHREFLSFWGYPGEAMSPPDRKEIFQLCELTPDFRKLLLPCFEEVAWESILYQGSWEKTIIGFSRHIQRLMGASLEKFFLCRTLDEVHDFLLTAFPARRWKLILSLLANANTFNALLYDGSFPKRNIPESYFRWYANGFERLFKLSPARENYLLQLVMLGRVAFPEGMPLEAHPELFHSMKSGIEKAEIRYSAGNVLDVSSSLAAPVDFLSFSDVPSYFAGEQERSFLQRLKPSLGDKAILAIRYFFHLPEKLDSSGFENVTAAHRERIEKDKTPFYRVEILEKRS